MSATEVRECFAAAGDGFVTMVAKITPEDWGRPALGEWTVRDLVGHTSRSFLTIETYLADPPTEIVLHSPTDYLLALRSTGMDPVAITARGRAAGAALGDDPAAAVRSLAERVTALVDETPDDAPLRTIAGGATLVTYLPTRTFELTVHTLDLATALGLDPPAVLAAPIAACLALAAAAAGTRPDAGALLLALTGRRGLPEGFSLV